MDYARVREYSLRVLTWRPDDAKALYRAGVAILEMGDAQTAKHYLTKACNEQPKGMNFTMFCSFSPDVFYLHISEPSSVLFFIFYCVCSGQLVILKSFIFCGLCANIPIVGQIMDYFFSYLSSLFFFSHKNRCQSKEAPAEGSSEAGPGAAERKSHVQRHVFLQT